jgi:hypothetical protein
MRCAYGILWQGNHQIYGHVGFWPTLAEVDSGGDLKIALSKSVMRNIARFRIRGHGLNREIGLYGRSPDRSARVCNLFENGDSIQDEKHVIFSCTGTEHLRHQFIHLFDNI